MRVGEDVCEIRDRIAADLIGVGTFDLGDRVFEHAPLALGNGWGRRTDRRKSCRERSPSPLIHFLTHRRAVVTKPVNGVFQYSNEIRHESQHAPAAR